MSDLTPDVVPPSRGWWSLSGDDFINALKRAHAGEDPEMVYAEWYANSQIEAIDGD